MSMRTRLTAALAAAAVATAACGHTVNERAWRAADERVIGHAMVDWPKYKRVVLDWCDDDDNGFNLLVAMEMDDPATGNVQSEKALLRTDVRYACPDRSDDLEQAFRLSSTGSRGD